jgi:hypothetical protein
MQFGGCHLREGVCDSAPVLTDDVLLQPGALSLLLLEHAVGGLHTVLGADWAVQARHGIKRHGILARIPTMCAFTMKCPHAAITAVQISRILAHAAHRVPPVRFALVYSRINDVRQDSGHHVFRIELR